MRARRISVHHGNGQIGDDNARYRSVSIVKLLLPQTGAANFRMRQRSSLSADDANRMMNAMRAQALQRGWNVAIAIVDDGGYLLRLDRMDGAGPMSPDIALGKARMASLTRRTTKEWEEKIQTRPAFLNFPFGLPIQGGVPIFHNSECVGAIGVSGMGSLEDEQLATTGVQALRDVA
jgi:glc operon protein GlcG